MNVGLRSRHCAKSDSACTMFSIRCKTCTWVDAYKRSQIHEVTEQISLEQHNKQTNLLEHVQRESGCFAQVFSQITKTRMRGRIPQMWCRANDLKTVVRFGLVCKRVGCLPKPVDCKHQEMAHGILHTVAERIKGGHAIRGDAVAVVNGMTLVQAS